MTREEKIKGLYSLKEYLVENPIELEGYKSLPITLIDYAIEALEQEITLFKSGLLKDCEYCKAKQEQALNKVRAEIIELRNKQNVGVLECLDIIDKYKAGSEGTP